MIEACRTCLKLIRLESVQYFEIEGANVQLSPNSNRFKILSVIPEMALNISKKSLICTSCHHSLETIYEFKEKCLRTESMIMRYIHSKPDLEIEALDLKDVAVVNNTGFVSGITSTVETTHAEKVEVSNNKNTFEWNRGNLLHKEILDRANASLGRNNSISLHIIGNVNAEKGSKDLDSKTKILENASANARNKNRNEENYTVKLCCKSSQQKQLSDNTNPKNQTEEQNHIIDNYSNNTNKTSEMNNQQKELFDCNSFASNKSLEKNCQEKELSENVVIKQELFPEDEEEGDNEETFFDTNIDVDENITVVKHELINDYYETEISIPPENTILNVSIKTDDSKSTQEIYSLKDTTGELREVKKPLEIMNEVENENVTAGMTTIKENETVARQIHESSNKYDLRKRNSKSRDDIESLPINICKRNIKCANSKEGNEVNFTQFTEIETIKLKNIDSSFSQNEVEDRKIQSVNKLLGLDFKNMAENANSSNGSQDKTEVKNTKNIVLARNITKTKESNNSPLNMHYEDNENIDAIDCLQYENIELPEIENSGNKHCLRNKTAKYKYSLRNKTGISDYKNNKKEEVKNDGLTTIRLKCVGSNLSIRRVIPNIDIKSYKETEKQTEVQVNTAMHQPELSLLAQKSNNKLPQLSLIPVNNKPKNQQIMKKNQGNMENDVFVPTPLSFIPNNNKAMPSSNTNDTSMEQDFGENYSITSPISMEYDGITKSDDTSPMDLAKSEDSSISIELDPTTKSEDTSSISMEIDAIPKSEDMTQISMEVDVILNESIKSNDSGIQNLSGSEQADDSPFKCQVCMKKFITKSRLKTHMLCHTDERPYKCTLCTKGFNDKSTLNKHLKIHSGIKEYECVICQRQFYCKGNLNKHMSTHSGDRPYKCNVCNRDFSRNEHLKQHRLIHTGDKNFECDICSKKFARRDSLIIHMMVHTGVRNYVCEYCDKRCIDSSTLKKHLRSHTGDKPYECETCHRRFTQKTHLTIHRRKHTGERPYNCTICNKGFYSSNYLKIHKRTHTKEQPYQCDVCKKRFSTVSNLRMHKKIHTGIRDFECGICSKMFIHKHDLRKHMMVHTQERPFSCHICEKAFNKKVRAKQHIINMHKEVDINTIVIEHHHTYVKTEPKADDAVSVK